MPLLVGSTSSGADLDTIAISWGDLLLTHEGDYRVGLIDGWEDLPDPRIDNVARPNAHGSFDAPVWTDARTVTVRGYCLSTTARNTLFQNLRRGAIPQGDGPAEDLTVAFAGQTLTAGARLSRFTPTLTNWGVGHFGWQIEWWCPDPLRYGDTTSTSTSPASDTGGLAFDLFGSAGTLQFGALGSTGQVTLANAGTAPSWPIYTVRGPTVSGWEIVEVTSGRRLRWESAVPSGSLITLNSRTGRVAKDGVLGWDGSLTRREWWSVPAGGSTVVQFVPLGTSPLSTMTATWRPAYW